MGFWGGGSGGAGVKGGGEGGVGEWVLWVVRCLELFKGLLVVWYFVAEMRLETPTW